MFSSSCFSLSGLMWTLKNMEHFPEGLLSHQFPLTKHAPNFYVLYSCRKVAPQEFNTHLTKTINLGFGQQENEKHHQKPLISQEKQLLWFLCYQDFFSSLLSLLIKTLHSCTVVYMQRWNLIRYLDTKAQVVLLANSPVSVLITTKAAGKQPNQNDCSKSQQSYKGKCVQNNDPSCW